MEIRECIINLLAAFIAVEYIGYGFEKKYCGWKRWICFIAGCSVYFFTLTIMDRFIRFEGLLCVFYGAALLIYARAVLKGQFHEELLMAVIWVLITFFATFCVYAVTGMVTGEQMEKLLFSDGGIFVCMALAASGIKFFMGRIVWKFYERKDEKNRPEDWMMLGVFVLILFLGLLLVFMEIGDIGFKARYILMICVLVGQFGGILLLEAVYRRLITYQKAQMEAEFKRKQEESRKENLMDIYRMGREINHWRHDMTGKMEVLRRLLQKECYREVAEHIESLCSELKQYQEMPVETGNEGLDAMLLKAVSICREKNIHFCYAVIGKTDKIDSMDMGILMWNLFDNAIEACCHTAGKRFMDLVIRGTDERTEIRLENSIRESVIENNPDLKSRKERSELHGFGMETIYGVIEKYKGEYHCSEEEDRFIQEIFLGQTGKRIVTDLNG